MEQRTLLIPALLDDHFPLLRWAFQSEGWRAVPLEEGLGAADRGLRTIHNDMCYPCILITGQILLALDSGAYDPARTAVLIGQAGDACRGSCYLRLLRQALDRAGYPQVAVLSLNVRDIDRETGLAITLPLFRRALAGAVWGDALMLLRNQLRPREAVPGSAQALWQRWIDTLSGDLRRGKPLSLRAILRRCREIAADFQALPVSDRPVRKVAVVGELYIKYCRLGNGDLLEYLAREGCAVGVGGLTWYALYYMDTHGAQGSLPLRLGYRLAALCAAGLQRRMVRILRQAGFDCPDSFPEFRKNAREIAPSSCTLGDGWLIGAEIVNWSRQGYDRMVCGQPFGCLPSHVCGRGIYAALQRRLPGVRLVSVDYDASIPDVTVKSRVRLLLDDAEV